MLYSSIKQQQLFLCIFWIAIISMIMPLKECYASGLSFTKIINSAGSTSLTVSNDPTKNTNIPLNGYFTPTFSNSVFNILNGYAGKTYIIDNTTKVKLERIVNGSTTPVGITFGATNTAMVINYANLIPGSQYKLTLKGDVTNADQTVTPGITANNNTMSLPSDTVIGFTTVAPAQPAAPSFTGATLVAGTLVLSGLPSNATNLEYCLAADGVNYAADWNDLTVTNQTAIISEQGLIPGTSKVQVCVKANPDMNTPAGVGAELTITGTVLPTPTAPSVQSAVLDGTTITLSGLPTGASNLEYSISEKGTNFTTWQVLSIASTTTQASLDTTGYTLDSSVSKIGVRVKADSSGTPAGDIATVPVVLALNVETPLVQGKTYVFASGITIYADTLNAGDNTVTVRDAKNQIVDYMNVLEPGYNDLESVYGVFLKGPGDAGTKKVVITIPIPDNIPKNEYNVCGVYDGIDMKYPNNTDPDTNDCAYWLYINNTDRSQMANNIFKVTCDDFAVDGSDHMYSVLYDTTTGPSTNQILYYGYVQGPNGNMAQKIKGIILDDSGTSEMDIYRDGVLYDHVGDKTSNNALFDRTGDLFYYDYNAKPGEFHSYKIMSYSVYGRINPFSQEITVVALSSQDIVNQTKAYIEDGTLQFSYAAGDSADSVTQGFETSTNVNKVDPKWVTCNPELGNITYTSDRPDILEFGSDCCNVFKPLDTDEAVVHVTANIQFLDPNTGNLTTVTATVPPITVKWTEETVIGNYASISKDDDAKLIAQLSAAADRSDVKTIIITRVWRHIFPTPCGARVTGPNYKNVVLNYLQHLPHEPTGTSIFMI
ncbi:hypothetical protein SBF1_2280004 [Candidatus Desulfosporosinus infrequens]|uniref:Uncharacterized protein n=1 Tax=Candidatus Desulfosporosinus infrequens TaxID=2043169 RepID=A0A2U3KLN0_9FIRM|nr:hypothetical protein SBF1_2280004 [Candidatus Desulfosporosinus infrequens]